MAFYSPITDYDVYLIYRKYHHDKLTFSVWYAFYENFVLLLSYDWGRVMAEDVPFHGRPYSLSLTLPPLGAVFLKPAYDICSQG